MHGVFILLRLDTCTSHQKLPPIRKCIATWSAISWSEQARRRSESTAVSPCALGHNSKQGRQRRAGVRATSFHANCSPPDEDDLTAVSCSAVHSFGARATLFRIRLLLAVCFNCPVAPDDASDAARHSHRILFDFWRAAAIRHDVLSHLCGNVSPCASIFVRGEEVRPARVRARRMGACAREREQRIHRARPIRCWEPPYCFTNPRHALKMVAAENPIILNAHAWSLHRLHGTPRVVLPSAARVRAAVCAEGGRAQLRAQATQLRAQATRAARMAWAG